MFRTSAAAAARPAGGFGAPAATPTFGAQAATTGFGGTSGGGGLFGTPAAAPAQGGFSFGGASTSFGAPAASAAPSLFGAPKPATTFGGFGGAQQQPASGGLFGGGGATMGGFGAQQQQQQQPGTVSVPFSATTIMEPPQEEGKPQPPNQTPHQFQSISAMNAYKNFSAEELRWQDYQAGRKQATAAAAPAFGSSFGQQQQQPGGFGAPAAAPSLFGQPAAPAFGQQAAPAFGQPAAGGLFGQPAATGFGATSAAPSLFGQPAQQPAQGGLFGGGGSTFGQPAVSAAPAFGGFGAAAPKPAGSFTFGQQPAAAAPAAGVFGQQPQQQGLFGQQSQAPAAGGLFGQPAQAPGAAGGFSFGGASAAAPAKPLFGATGSTFGQPAAAAPKPGGFSFGAPAAPAAGGSLFGQPQQQAGGFGAPPAAGGGLFGGGSTFGQPAQQQAPASTFGAGMFGAKPAAAPLFGSAPAPSLFGQPQQQAQPQQPSLFGGGQSTFGSTFGAQSTAAPPQQSAYAQADDANAYGSRPLFANSTSSTAATPDAKKKPPLFTAFKGTPINRSSTKITRMRGFGNSTSTASPSASGSPSLMFSTNSHSSSNGALGSPHRGSPLRLVNGLGDETSAGAMSPHAFVSRPNVKKLVINQKTASPDPSGAPPRSANSSGAAAASTSALRPKVTFNPELDVSRGSPTPFQDEGLDESYGPGDATPVKRSGGSSSNLFPTPLPSNGVSNGNGNGISNGNGDSPFASHRHSPAPTSSTPAAPKHGNYISSPSIATLQSLPSSSLRAVPNLTVSRLGYGSVAFLDPVDLTTLDSVRDLLGEIIVLEDRNATVYPDATRFPKPDEGKGLNVPAVITLEKCWPVDKATRQPIKEKDHPRMSAHIKRLQRLPDTEFISFDPATGTWVMEVKGF
ncbi:hypothetical protein RQP46_001319 [Phenoliferia psychrophenolica]